MKSATFAGNPVLCDSSSYVEDHKPIDVYIRNITPFRIRLPRRRSWPYRGGAILNFAITEFSEVHSESALGAKTALGIGASLVAAFLPDLRFGALRVEAQAG